MNGILVSVVVPVFNAEKYIEQCILSILNQTLSAIEIIIVNDGSTDGSAVIIHRQRDERIIVIDSVNKGVSAARNAGIKVAKGQFIGFVDADDYVDPLMFERLYKEAIEQQADLVICDAKMVEGIKPLRPRLQLKGEVIETAINRPRLLFEFLHFKYEYANWNKLFSLDIIRIHKLHFKEGMLLWEDILFNILYLQHAKRIAVLSDCLYFYRVQEMSTIAITKVGFSKQYNKFFEEFSSFCLANNEVGQLELFKKELAGSCIGTIFLFIKRSISTRSAFSKFFMIFRAELKQLNPAIYNGRQSVTTSDKIKDILLIRHFLTLFAFVYTAEFMIKDAVRPILNRSSKYA